MVENDNQVVLSVIVPVYNVEEYVEECIESILNQELSVPFMFAPPHLSHQRAGAVAYLGLQLMKKGFVEDAASHRPEYLRVSQAERERQEQENAHDC